MELRSGTGLVRRFGQRRGPLEGLVHVLQGRTARGDQGHSMLGERIAPQSEVIRAMLLEDSPCCGVGPAPSGRWCCNRLRSRRCRTARAAPPPWSGCATTRWGHTQLVRLRDNHARTTAASLRARGGGGGPVVPQRAVTGVGSISLAVRIAPCSRNIACNTAGSRCRGCAPCCTERAAATPAACPSVM